MLKIEALILVIQVCGASKNVLSLFFHFICSRYIRSERSVILINFCLSIISSNALILIGQTQTRNRVRTKQHLECMLTTMHFLDLSSLFVYSVVSGLMHPYRCIPSLLLPFLILLGSDRGVAVIHGSDRPPQESHHTQAFPVSRLGWAFCLLLYYEVVHIVAPNSAVLIFVFILLPGLPALVVAISVGFTKAKGYGTPS